MCLKPTLLISLLILLALGYQKPVFASSNPETITYQESNEDFANPERGFMKQSSIYPDQVFDANKVRRQDPADSLVWIYFRLDNYRDKIIDQNGLANIRLTYQTARDKGLKLVIRFIYNWGPGWTNDPNLANPDAPIELVRQHLEQLRSIIYENADVTATMQAGFVGHWGEWHSTKHLHPLEYRKEIVDTLLDILPKDRMLQLRYPRYKEIFYQGPLTESVAFSQSNASRIGHHNDCFLRDNDDTTYRSTTGQLPKHHSTYCDGQNEITCWQEFVAQEGQYTPIGGETCQYNPPRSDCANAIGEMAMLHWSFINNDYQPEVLNSWVNNGCMPEIRRRLGYRLILNQAIIPQVIQPGELLNFEINLKNAGFASMYNPRSVYLVLLGNNNRYDLLLPEIDPRRWLAGQDYNLIINTPIPANILPGNYKIGLWLPDAYNSLQNNLSYTVRFANTNIWDVKNGLNILDADISVSGSVSACIGDVNQDSQVGLQDLLSILNNWGQIAGLSDLNQDHRVDIADLLILLTKWGQC